ncbi:hypothetical protein GQ43DRAFT_361554 [Delitschia confertaspora ATCC 74209]|uniref:DUF7580 domain-containing protein n=1 Tax=Delitschia confertaspora ATCC 74209 TaxID=1513339 RepID=A0A9P4JV35_9PLEO|nr:hypothetical protein GQ43DRAFT_361554 [Delitschia confertaspora ATCC 74209]
MSGLEIAGVVLGVLPLFIQALEDYNEGLDPVKAFLRWERELPHFIRKLRNQHVHFQQTLRLLLEPIATDSELAEMLAAPAGKLWKEEGMAEKLQDKLQESFQAYQNIITDIERIMKKIASKLDLERAANITQNELEAMLVANPQKSNNKFEFKKRVRFGMSKKTIKGLLQELDDCNKELERFTDRSEKLETYRKPTRPSFAARLQRIQGYAKSLHQVLLSSWTCSCASSQCTNLQLEQRVNIYAANVKNAKPAAAGTRFTVSFSSTCRPGIWQEAEIHIEEEEDIVPPPVVTHMKPKISKTVSFSKPPPPYSVKPDPDTTLTTLHEVEDICSAIRKLHKHSPCIGFSLDTQRKLRGTYPVDTHLEKPPVPYELVTLEELMTCPPLVNGRPAKLSKKERYSLAVTLASSTLQLYSTSWFPEQWSKKNIVFHRTAAGPRICDIEHPYITSKLSGIHKEASNLAEKSRTFHNKNTILLALAVALLELYFGVSAEQHQEAEHSFGNGQSNPWTICAMAYEWTDNERENLSAAFLAAVTHCLRCFGDPGASLQDADFLQAAVEGIVLPLQDELWQFLGKPGL